MCLQNNDAVLPAVLPGCSMYHQCQSHWNCCQSLVLWILQQCWSRSSAAARPPAPWSRCCCLRTDSLTAGRCCGLPSPDHTNSQIFFSCLHFKYFLQHQWRILTWNLSLSCSERLYHQTLHCLLNSSISLWISSSGYCLLCWAQQACTNTPYAVFFWFPAASVILKLCFWKIHKVNNVSWQNVSQKSDWKSPKILKWSVWHSKTSWLMTIRIHYDVSEITRYFHRKSFLHLLVFQGSM